MTKIDILGSEHLQKMIDALDKQIRTTYQEIQKKNIWQSKAQELEGNGDFWLEMEQYFKELQDTRSALIVLKKRTDEMEGY